jgi:hypothetical protein
MLNLLQDLGSPIRSSTSYKMLDLLQDVGNSETLKKLKSMLGNRSRTTSGTYQHTDENPVFQGEYRTLKAKYLELKKQLTNSQNQTGATEEPDTPIRDSTSGVSPRSHPVGNWEITDFQGVNNRFANSFLVNLPENLRLFD